MEQQRDGGTLQQHAEEVIRRLRGVVSVRVEADPSGGLSVVHVLGEADRSPKLIAMDVASALAAELSVQVDPRQIRVSTLRSGETPPPPPSPRLKYVGLTVASLRGTTEVKVHLEDRGLLYEGVASGPTSGNSLHLVAQATLRAVEVFLRAAGMLLLDGVRVARVGEREVAVVVLTLAGGDGHALSGSSVVRLDPREAVVRAVLNALNRPVGWLAAGRPQ